MYWSLLGANGLGYSVAKYENMCFLPSLLLKYTWLECTKTVLITQFPFLQHSAIWLCWGWVDQAKRCIHEINILYSESLQSFPNHRLFFSNRSQPDCVINTFLLSGRRRFLSQEAPSSTIEIDLWLIPRTFHISLKLCLETLHFFCFSWHASGQ